MCQRRPTQAQATYVAKLAYPGDPPLTCREATFLLTRLEEGASWLEAATDLPAFRRKEFERWRAEMDSTREYLERLERDRAAVGFRFSADKERVNEEHVQYDRSFLSLEVAKAYPWLLTIEGLDHDERVRRPSRGIFVIHPGKVVTIGAAAKTAVAAAPLASGTAREHEDEGLKRGGGCVRGCLGGTLIVGLLLLLIVVFINGW